MRRPRTFSALLAAVGLVFLAGALAGLLLGADSGDERVSTSAIPVGSVDTLDPDDRPPPWLRKDGSIDYSRVPSRLELLVPGGDRAGYIDSDVIFDEGEPRVVPRGESDPTVEDDDGPFPVFRTADSQDVVGQYFRSIGFVRQDVFESDGFDLEAERAKASPPTTIEGE